MKNKKRYLYIIIMVFSLFSVVYSNNCYALDDVEAILKAVKNKVKLGDPIALQIGVKNNTYEDIYLLDLFNMTPIMWQDKKVVLNYAMLFDPLIKGYEFLLPSTRKIRANEGGRIKYSPSIFKTWISHPYWVRLIEIIGSDLHNLMLKEEDLNYFISKYETNKNLPWFVDVKLKEGKYEFVAVISYTDKATVRHFEDVLEKEEEEYPFDSTIECTSWAKRVKYIKNHIKIVYSNTITVEILQ